MGYISEGERMTVKQQWKFCHKFLGSIMQDLPHLAQFARNRLQNRHTALYSHYRKIEDMKSRSVLSGFKPATLYSKLFVAPLANDDSGLVFPAFPVPWQSSWVLGRMHRYLAVAFLVSGLLQTTPCAPYSSKQQRPTAWITARRFRLKSLGFKFLGLLWGGEVPEWSLALLAG